MLINADQPRKPSTVCKYFVVNAFILELNNFAASGVQFTLTNPTAPIGGLNVGSAIKISYDVLNANGTALKTKKFFILLKYKPQTLNKLGQKKLTILIQAKLDNKNSSVYNLDRKTRL